ncbi:MAG: hypothetical protein ACRCSN_13200 [Dermatophilaceae bacterium]
MSRQDAKELQRELNTLVSRFFARHDDTQPAYVVGASLAPLQDELPSA